MSDLSSEQRGERLQKVLAGAGVASRRECETLILEGRVEVDRQTVTVLGTRVDPQRQEIRVDGVTLGKRHLVCYVLNKPTGVVSTHRDPAGRPRVIDMVPSDQRLFTIGRLDCSSEGMIIVTNDGDLANRVSHPRYGVAKTYRARVLGTPTRDTLDKLRAGVQLAEGRARVASLTICGKHPQGVDLEIVLSEGRNREIRRMLAQVGHKVQRLKRTAIGPLRLGTLKVGEYRRLTREEVHLLRDAVPDAARQGGVSRRSRQVTTSRARRAQASQAAARGGRKPAAGSISSRRPSAGRPPSSPRGSRPAAAGGQSAPGNLGGTVLDYEGESKPRRTGMKAQATSKKSYGTGKRAYGTGEKSYVTGEKSEATSKKSYGTGKKSHGTGKKAYGTGKKAHGTGKKSHGAGKKSYGKGKRR
jgi:23S rRNA pseudouridine2605 synthase